MKKIVSLLVLSVVFLTSCTSEDKAGIEETALLKSYEIKKDINGRFTIDYKVNETVVSDFVKNYENGYNEIYLYEGSKVSEEGSKSISSKNIDLNNNELKVGFYENNTKKTSILIEDGNIELSKSLDQEIETSPYLESYSITNMGNDEFMLAFHTKNNVEVSFSFDELTQSYKINLIQGEKEASYYTKTYIKTETTLRIDFVNYIIVEDGIMGRSIEYTKKERPRTVVVG